LNANPEEFVTKLADLGNSIVADEVPNDDCEIQTSYYRAPEVFLGRFV
jgi:serine/threonine protein kinase